MLNSFVMTTRKLERERAERIVAAAGELHAACLEAKRVLAGCDGDAAKQCHAMLRVLLERVGV